MRASQTVDEVEGQAGPAGRLPRVEDLLAVDLCERHLGCLLGGRGWYGRDTAVVVIGVVVVPRPRCKIDQGFIWRRIDRSHNTHDGGLCDRSTRTDDDNQQIEKTPRSRPEITSFWGTRDWACSPPARDRLLL